MKMYRTVKNIVAKVEEWFNNTGNDRNITES